MTLFTDSNSIRDVPLQWTSQLSVIRGWYVNEERANECHENLKYGIDVLKTTKLNGDWEQRCFWEKTSKKKSFI